LVFKAHLPVLFIHDPDVVHDLYNKHNKFFDKHPIVKHLTDPLMGRSILFANTDPDWKARRSALSPAFYK